MFFIIWGFRSSAKSLAVLTLACRNGHTAAHRLVRVTRKFTLFFVPLFPVRRRYLSVCSLCGLQVSWTREMAEEAVASVTSAPAPAPAADPVSPPVNPALPPRPTAPPPGWYPAGQPGQVRYWDGSSWTEHTQPVVEDLGK